MNILVVTIVHTPLDARIYHRQIGALVGAGHAVTYAAPWSARAVEPPEDVVAIDLPRAAGRGRLHAIRAARKMLADRGSEFDVVLVHDPDLLAAVSGIPEGPVVVWDVHEDTASALVDRDWMPAALRPAAQRAVRSAEQRAEHRLRILLAEDRYAERFSGTHPIVHNYPLVPARAPVPPGDDRVVYVGRVSRSRGLDNLIGVGRALDSDVTVRVVGWADAADEGAISAAAAAKTVSWSGPGYVPNDLALAEVDGALAGLSLLRDQPNYRHSLPTKIVEYMARGVPVITTPLPVAVELVEAYDCGIVVPFDRPEAVVAAIHELRHDPATRTAMGARGYRGALEHHNWAREGTDFVAQLQRWVDAS